MWEKVWKGIDVSDNQGAIEWGKVKAAGCQFAILRSVRRSGKVDYQFEANVKGCKAQNIPISVYKYTYATTEEMSANEARQVVALLQKYGLKCKVWWDVEDRDTLFGLGKAKLTACIKAAEKVITEAGYEFGIYTGMYIYKEQWFDFDQFSCQFWGARYPSTSAKTMDMLPDEKYLPYIGRPLWGWQFSSNGTGPGISTNVDLDICFFEPDAHFSDAEEKKYTLGVYDLSPDDIRTIKNKLSGMELESSAYIKAD